LCIIVALLAFANAHSYMNIPNGYPLMNPQPESQTSPCGVAQMTNYTTMEVNNFLQVGWVYNTHEGQTSTVSVSLLTTSNVFVQSLFNTTFTPNSYTYRLPSDIPLGDYHLQWYWIGWYTCAWIKVTANTRNVTDVLPGQTVTPNLLAKIDGYEMSTDNVNNANFMYVTATPSVAGTYLAVVLSTNPADLPTLTSYNEFADTTTTATGTVSVGACPPQVNSADIYEIGVTGGAGASGTVSYSMTFYEYNGLINSGDSLSVTEHNGDRYFYTQAYTTTDKSQMVVLRSTLSHNYISMFVDTSCSFNTNNLVTATYPDDQTICAQLGTTTGNKYIKVEGIQSDYTIDTEAGTCSSIGDAASVVISFSVVFFALLVALLV